MISDVTGRASALDLDEGIKAGPVDDSVVRFLTGPCTTTLLVLVHRNAARSRAQAPLAR